MGEIGIAPDVFKERLIWWEVLSIIRGYNRRHRDLWSVGRWHAYHVMVAQAGSEAMQKAGLYGPTDLIHFPWDVKMAPVTQDVVAEMQAELAAFQAQK